ncbi:hypothetical protein MNBD_BACTEROID05-482 [hydrothermal vent metagenome]|uniref:Uncharacterized protein n=1 Tax=hydrothermal vent metagenome TaxID=652676 RepID=A0A3B0UJ38_9ZZZZ
MKKIFLLSSGVLLFILSANVCLAAGVIEMQKMNLQKAQQKSQAQQRNAKQQSLQEELQQKNQNRLSAYQSQYEEKVVDFSQVFEELKINSEVWAQLIDNDPKVMILDKYKQWYSDQGIQIRKESLHYAGIIDSMARTDENLLKTPFKNVLRFVAIMEYDYDNGQDKDALAQKVLGAGQYQANKRRLSAEEQKR